MAGVIKGEVQVNPRGLISVVPTLCAVEGHFQPTEPACYRTYPDGEWRQCPYLISTTAPSNFTDRQHPTALRTRAVGLGARSISCGIICARARANRPPGC
jgi:hypothetical protein